MNTNPRVHVVTNDGILAKPDFLAVASTLLDLPIALHLRGRSVSGLQIYTFARALQPNNQPGKIVINDRVDVAVAADVTRVHLPENGLPPDRVKAEFGEDMTIGTSAHSAQSAKTALGLGADYVFLGPVWATTSHPERQPLGVHEFRALDVENVIAIGGVTVDRVAPCRAAGAFGIAVISAVWNAPDPASVTHALCDIFQGTSNSIGQGLESVKQQINVTINGEKRSVRSGNTLMDLLEELQLDPRMVVVEHNKVIVRRPNLAATKLDEGDTVELVHFVGGG